MKNQIVKVDPKEFGLEPQNVTEIEKAFAPKIIERDELAKIYKDLITKELTPELSIEAKALRLKLVKVRTGIASTHTTQKAFFLAAGRFVDAWKNKETLPVQQMEKKLKDIEDHFKKQAEEAKKKLQKEREDMISEYIDDANLRDLAEMDQDLWETYLSAKKKDHENKLEGERIAEEKRLKQEAFDNLKIQRRIDLKELMNYIDDLEELVSIEDETAYNDRIDVLKAKKAEKDEQERKAREFEALKQERRSELMPFVIFIKDFKALVCTEDPVEYEKQLSELKTAKKEHDESERIKAEKEKEKKKLVNKRTEDLNKFGFTNQDTSYHKDKYSISLVEISELDDKQFTYRIKEINNNIARDKKIKQEEADRIESERKEQERIQDELNKGDEAKFNDLVKDLKDLKTKYEFKSEKNKKMYQDVGSLMDKVIEHINK